MDGMPKQVRDEYLKYVGGVEFNIVPPAHNLPVHIAEPIFIFKREDNAIEMKKNIKMEDFA